MRALAVHFPGWPGYLKAVWPETSGPVFPGFSPETDPGDPEIPRTRPAREFARKISAADQF